MRKSLAAAGLTASLLGGSIAGAVLLPSGVSFAQEDVPAETTDARTPGQWVADVLADLVTDGVIDQAQADAVATALQENRPERPFGQHGHRGAKLDAAAEALGLEADDLASRLRDGATLAEVAADVGVSVDDLVAALVAEAEEHLAQAVEDGRLTQEEADEKAEGLTERITARVNGELPEDGPEGRGPRGPRGPRPDAAPDASADA